MLRLTIILPALGDQVLIENTLVSVLTNKPSESEIVVACRSSYADAYDLEGEVRFVRAKDDQPHWVELANIGLSHALGDYVHLLMPGCEVHDGWCEQPIQGLQHDPKIGMVAPKLTDKASQVLLGVVQDHAGDRRLALDTNESTVDIDGPSKWAGFFRAMDLNKVHGWNAAVGPDFADLDLALRLFDEGFECRVVPGSKIDFADGFRTQARGYPFGIAAERFYWQQHALPSGRMLMRPVSILLHAMLPYPKPSSLSELAGRIVGFGTRHAKQMMPARVEGDAKLSPLRPAA